MSSVQDISTHCQQHTVNNVSFSSFRPSSKIRWAGRLKKNLIFITTRVCYSLMKTQRCFYVGHFRITFYKLVKQGGFNPSSWKLFPLSPT